MESCKNPIRKIAIFSSILAIILIFSFWQLLTNKFLYPTERFYSNIFNSNSSAVLEKDELQRALEKASMANDKTVIIAFINEAYVEPHENEYPSMFDIFLEGFWVGVETRPLVDHLVVVAMDRTAHERCEFRRLNCYRLDGGDRFAGEKVFMSGEFIEMMWRRTRFLLDVLNRGFNFIFTDTDVLWVRNPFISKGLIVDNKTFDLQISTDKFNGDAFSDKNEINTGFYFVRSNNRTTSLFQKWFDSRKISPGTKEQDVLAYLISKGMLKRFNVRAAFLDTRYFSGFCNDSKDVGSVATIHANCCRTIRAKVVDLKAVLRDWKSRDVANNTFRWSKHVTCENSWHK